MCAVHLHVHMEIESNTNKVKGKLVCCGIKRDQIISSTISQVLSRFRRESWHQSPRPLFVFIKILVLPLSLCYKTLIGQLLACNRKIFLEERSHLTQQDNVYMISDKIE